MRDIKYKVALVVSLLVIGCLVYVTRQQERRIESMQQRNYALAGRLDEWEWINRIGKKE